MLNRPISWVWVLLALCAWGGWTAWTHREISHPPGVLVAADPEQIAIDTPEPFDHDGYRITPLAHFDLRARVLSRADYRLDAMAALVPTDLALGWGRMSDSAVLKAIDISQSGRFFFWRVQQFPIPEREIITHAANMHLIPANAEVRRLIGKVRRGQVIGLRGELVAVVMPNGATLRSSLSRDDTGAGACELIWVEDLQLQ